MSLSDPIGDMIARIKNAQVRNHKKVALPSSNFKVKIADILKSEGFIKDYKVETELKKPVLIPDDYLNPLYDDLNTPGYIANLHKIFEKSQKGDLNDKESKKFENKSYFKPSILLRKFDEAAKRTDIKMKSIHDYDKLLSSKLI